MTNNEFDKFNQIIMEEVKELLPRIYSIASQFMIPSETVLREINIHSKLAIELECVGIE